MLLAFEIPDSPKKALFKFKKSVLNSLLNQIAPLKLNSVVVTVENKIQWCLKLKVLKHQLCCCNAEGEVEENLTHKTYVTGNVEMRLSYYLFFKKSYSLKINLLFDKISPFKIKLPGENMIVRKII